MMEKIPLQEMLLPLGLLMGSVGLGYSTAIIFNFHGFLIYLFILVYFFILSILSKNISFGEFKKFVTELFNTNSIDKDFPQGMK